MATFLHWAILFLLNIPNWISSTTTESYTPKASDGIDSSNEQSNEDKDDLYFKHTTRGRLQPSFVFVPGRKTLCTATNCALHEKDLSSY